MKGRARRLVEKAVRDSKPSRREVERHFAEEFLYSDWLTADSSPEEVLKNAVAGQGFTDDVKPPIFSEEQVQAKIRELANDPQFQKMIDDELAGAKPLTPRMIADGKRWLYLRQQSYTIAVGNEMNDLKCKYNLDTWLALLAAAEAGS